MKFLVILCTLLAAVSAATMMDLVKEEWASFKMQHNKDYKTSTEENFRKNIYVNNKIIIERHNQNFHQGLKTYKLGINKYSDMLHHEFVATLNGYNKTQLNQISATAATKPKALGATFVSPANVKIASTVDWTKKGAVTPIKDQGHCGSCWSFSATGALEGQNFRKTGRLVSLSEQNLVDCSTKYGNNGCNGGLMDNAFTYIKDNGGIDTEKTYPYEGIDDSCKYNPSNSGASDKGFVDVPSGDEDALKSALATMGPISVAIDASHESFQFYSAGVYYEEQCDAQTLDHGVLAVGYGTDETGGDYWLVKNSWGTTWGDQGYIKMARNKANNCGIATQASYPLV